MKSLTNSITHFQRKFSLSKKVFFVILLFIAALLAVILLNHPANQNTTETLPQDQAIQVYFNQNQASLYEDPYRHFTRKGDNLEQQVIDIINQAHKRVDIAVMEFRLPKIAQALTEAHKRGVKVRLVIDNKYNKTLNEYTNEEITRMNQHEKLTLEELKRYPADALAIVRSDGIEIKDDTSDRKNKGSGIMHHKFVVVDDKDTIISSANFSMSDMHGHFDNLDTRGNPNNLIFIPNNTQVAKIFTEEFNYMWSGLFKAHKPQRPPVTIPVGQGTITIHFSPAKRKEEMATTSNGMIISYLQQAKKSVHLALFVFSNQKISDTLNTIHNQGVEDIKLLIDSDFFARSYSKAYDAMGICPGLSKKQKHTTKAKLHPWTHPITTVGFPVGPTGDRGVHSKMAILDGILVIAGSHNWSDSADYSNDETLIAVQNSIVSPHYDQEFNRLYQTAEVSMKTLPHANRCG